MRSARVGEAGRFVGSDGHCVGKRRWSAVRAKRIRTSHAPLCSMVSTESRPLGRLPSRALDFVHPREVRATCRWPLLPLSRLQSGRLFGYLARRPGNRATTARCPRGRAGTRRVQEVGARGWRCQNGEKMVDERLSAADRALRTRITQLSVHIPCGGLRGPLQRTSRPYPGLHIRWQSCPDEDSPQKWAGCDVSRQFDLCIICFRATAGGTSRWSWRACEDCRDINESIGSRWGFRPFALGRHSLMNGIGVRGGAPPEVQQAQIERLMAFLERRRRPARVAQSRIFLVGKQVRSSSRHPIEDVAARMAAWQERIAGRLRTLARWVRGAAD